MSKDAPRTRTPRRRSVVAAGAWAAPAVVAASATPAFAASPCITQLLNWDSYPTGAAPPASIVIAGVTITRSLAYGGGATPNPSSGFVLAGPQGGIVGNALAIAMGATGTPVATGNSAVLTLSFDTAIKDLSFTLTDIDRVQAGWRDQVSVTPGFTLVGTLGSNINVGNGSAGTPWSSTNNVNLPGTNSTGNVAVRYAGPISTVSITYTNGADAGANSMAIFLSDVSFCA
jgi:hypothetical protein